MPHALPPDEAQAWVKRWSEEALARLDALARSHEKERRDLEAQLETQTCPATYSSFLLDLLQKEERAASQGMHELHRQISARVDVALRSELERHFRARSTGKQRQWTRLLEAQAREVARCASSIREEILQMNESLRLTLPQDLDNDLSNPGVFALQASQKGDRFNLEACLQVECMERYAQHEAKSLQEALNLQVARVDAEWEAYLAQVEGEYLARREALEGYQGRAGSRRSLKQAKQASVSPLLRSAEKQSRLTVTAPVLSPEAFGAQPSSVFQRRGSRTNSLHKDIAAIEEAFQACKRQMLQQKAMAKTWISRQAARMEVHLEHVAKEKELLVGFLKKEYASLGIVRKWIENYTETAAES